MAAPHVAGAAARTKSVSFRADITDRQGNTSSVSVYDAYFGK